MPTPTPAALQLRIVPKPTFKATVHITVPGEAAPAAIELEFRHLGRQALRAWVERGRAPNPDGSLPTDVQWLGEVVAGWAGPVDEAGAPAPFTTDAFAALLDAYAAAAREIYDGYVQALSEGRAKN
jgi:hypothetical protein